uniref:mitogen-activated protein kinase kinase n=2 Tax=Palpitomonas bilix TaxID=652834 RepID=A0A7S3GCC9_9EUKA|mmetsp:Transcript_42814/g.110426  ORF Transcript_42814/g.110426 Transcript_42814/m.110426 type:complete len:318 (+) Transcript_42814:256-1209(+)
MEKDAILVSLSGSAEVWRVRDKQTGELLVKKVVPVSLCGDQVESFIDTVSSVHSSDSPYISRFIRSEFNEAEDCAIIYTEYLDAGSLEDVMRSRRKIPEEALKELSYQVVCALCYLHRERSPHLIHRNLKPTNVLLSRDGTVKLGDFGHAKELNDAAGVGHSFLGGADESGRCYLSPERVMAVGHSFNTDVWSLGVVLYEAATGTHPYVGRSSPSSEPGTCAFSVMERIVDEDPPQLPTEFSDDFRFFVSSCLTKAAEDRPNSSDLLNYPFLSKIHSSHDTLSERTLKWPSLASLLTDSLQGEGEAAFGPSSPMDTV